MSQNYAPFLDSFPDNQIITDPLQTLFPQMNGVVSYASQPTDCVGCDTHIGQEFQRLQVLS
jgi:hypothetical protein